jgi:hypothetical protein
VCAPATTELYNFLFLPALYFHSRIYFNIDEHAQEKDFRLFYFFLQIYSKCKRGKNVKMCLIVINEKTQYRKKEKKRERAVISQPSIGSERENIQFNSTNSSLFFAVELTIIY